MPASAQLVFALLTTLVLILGSRSGSSDAERLAAADSLALSGEVYALQLDASDDSLRIAHQLDSLRRAAVPAYVVRTLTNGTTYHRLRVGPFQHRPDAEAFAAFHGYEGFWIGQATGDSAAFGPPIARVVTDVVSTHQARTYYYLGRQHALLAVLLARTGPRAAVHPSDLRLYLRDRPRPVELEEVTGFEERERAVVFGQAQRVYVSPQRQTAEALAEDVAAFSRESGVPPAVVRDGLTLYNNGLVARFTTLGAYDLRRDTLVFYPQAGFDYAGFGGVRRRFRGAVPAESRLRRGNARAAPLPGDTLFSARNERAVLYTRLLERGDAFELCAVFFAVPEPPVAVRPKERPGSPGRSTGPGEGAESRF